MSTSTSVFVIWISPIKPRAGFQIRVEKQRLHSTHASLFGHWPSPSLPLSEHKPNCHRSWPSRSGSRFIERAAQRYATRLGNRPLLRCEGTFHVTPMIVSAAQPAVAPATRTGIMLSCCCWSKVACCGWNEGRHSSRWVQSRRLLWRR